MIVPERPIRATRPEPREIVELKQLKTAQPELASAVDMQLALIEMQRRVQSRVPLPWIHVEPEWLRNQYAAGRPVVRFRDIPLEWTDFRLTLRQTADILRRFDALEQPDYERIVALGRGGNLLEPIVTQWYERTSGVNGDGPSADASQELPAGLDQVLVLAIRPFLARCAEVLVQRADLPEWTLGLCPFCGWEPDFALITPSAERRLICGRCLAQWPFDGVKCPFCSNDDRALITSFATRDGVYRVSGCDVCRRYIKAYDGRGASRPILLALDTIATLPLDAAAIQRGYLG
jgi:Protein involved in formate dehydrogenase formation